MLVICEGTDGGGKSTLAEALKEEWSHYHWASEPLELARVIHTGPPPDPTADVFADYEMPFEKEPLKSEVLSDKHLVILDRWHLGDRIYGPKYRGFARYTEAGLLHTEMMLNSLGAVKVICSPPLSIVQKRVVNRGDDYIDIEDLPRIYAEYIEHGERYGYYFFGMQDSQLIVQHLLNDASYKTTNACELYDVSAGTYTGALFPDIIIAGDQLGGTPELQLKRGGFTRPFTPNSPATSCEWLMSAIYQTGFLNIIGLVNVNHPGVDAGKLAQLRPHASWVALGAAASTTLSYHKIKHQRISHPSYARRFRHAYHDEYARQLKGAMIVSG
jgi:hypothetical protein